MSGLTGVDAVRVVHRPTRLSGGAAVALGVAALAVLGNSSTVWTTLLVLSVGLGLLALGTGLRTAGRRLRGLALSFSGGLVVLVALGLAATGPARVGVRLWLVAGVLAVTLVGIAVVPLRGQGSRGFLRAGSVLLFLTVLLAGLLALAPLSVLLVGGVAAILVWDVGENAIGLGEQLGRTATTTRVELTHLAASGLVAVVAVVAGVLVEDVRTPGLSLTSFVLLLLALVLFAAALRN